GERAGNGFGRLERLSFAWEARGNAETREPHLATRAVHQDIGRFDVLVDEAALVDLAQSPGNADGEATKTPHLHGRAKQPLKRLAAEVLKHQHGATAFADELQRPCRPGSVEFVLQLIFVSEAIEAG